MSHQSSPSPLTRRSVLAGISATGLGLTAIAAARPAASQETASDLATHSLVGLWQYLAPPAPDLPAQIGFELYHADGTFTTWSGWDMGAALGIWRPTGARTAEVLLVWIDNFPYPSQGDQRAERGTATMHVQLEVDAAGTTLRSTQALVDVRNEAGTHPYPPQTLPDRTATRVTFEWNPMTGSTVPTPEATPES